MKKKEEFPEPNYAQTIALHLCKCYEGIGGINLCSDDRAYTYDGNPVEDIEGKFSTFCLEGETTILRKFADTVKVRVMVCNHSVEVVFDGCGTAPKELSSKLLSLVHKCSVGETDDLTDLFRVLPEGYRLSVRYFA